MTIEGRIGVGTILHPLRPGVESCEIIDTPIPPRPWTVRYKSGKIKKWSKSHLRKYYTLDESKKGTWEGEEE